MLFRSEDVGPNQVHGHCCLQIVLPVLVDVSEICTREDMTSILNDMDGTSKAMQFWRKSTTSNDNSRCAGTVASCTRTLTELYDALEDNLQVQPIGNSNVHGAERSAEPSQVPKPAPKMLFCDVTSGNSFTLDIYTDFHEGINIEFDFVMVLYLSWRRSIHGFHLCLAYGKFLFLRGIQGRIYSSSHR